MPKIIDTKKGRILEDVVSLPYRWAYGPVWTRFFDEFKQKRIMGTKCPQCKRVLVPARKFCPRCFEDTDEWVEVSSEGIIKTWVMITFEFTGQVQKPPYIEAMIDLDGADTSFNHLIGGIDLNDFSKVKERVKIGGRVKAKWAKDRKGDIHDIEYFEPV